MQMDIPWNIDRDDKMSGGVRGYALFYFRCLFLFIYFLIARKMSHRIVSEMPPGPCRVSRARLFDIFCVFPVSALWIFVWHAAADFSSEDGWNLFFSFSLQGVFYFIFSEKKKKRFITLYVNFSRSSQVFFNVSVNYEFWWRLKW